MVGAERDWVAGFGRLEDGLRGASDWYLRGPYASERQWGTVREDYSAAAGCAITRRTMPPVPCTGGVDGLAGLCDVEQQSWTATVYVGLRALISSLGHAVGRSRRDGGS